VDTVTGEGLLAAYRPVGPGGDEMVAPDGALRPHWADLAGALDALGPAELARRAGDVANLLAGDGVTYNVGDVGSGGGWSLDPVPLLLPSEEWSRIENGVIQRAELLDLVLSDLYGPRDLLRRGLLPPEVVYGHSGFLRPCDGARLPGPHQLFTYAVDIGRGPDQTPIAMADHTQAPSGAGYALENRLVLSRAFSDLYKSMNVPRVAPFFEAFRDSLRARADRDEPRIGVLTPGSFSETYFEHATLARYLGFLLVEGDDLAVSDNRVHIRTVAGLKRLDVLLRRVDSNSLDPLELDASSRLGVPGLIDVLRKDGVVVANMPGSGVLEARALLGFLPALSRRLLGEDLKMPHIATWWCGQRAARDEVLARLDEVAIEGAYRRGVPGIDSNGPVLAS
jgi:uncharacterized circularly permuted ATP-grasp superfamily protein